MLQFCVQSCHLEEGVIKIGLLDARDTYVEICAFWQYAHALKSEYVTELHEQGLA